MKVAVLTVSHRCHHIVLCPLSSETVAEVASERFWRMWLLMSRLELSPSPLLIFECFPSCFNWGL